MPPKRNLPTKHRRKPFSNKQKKQQLQEKRQRKRERDKGSAVAQRGSTCLSLWLHFPPESLPVDGGVEDREKEEQEEGEGEDSSTETGSEGEIPVAKLNLQPSAATGTSRYDPNRFHMAPALTSCC